MNWNRVVRQGHRWISIIFTATVLANFIAVATGRAMEWLYMLPLAPLLLLMLSGVYMFFLPYVRRPRDSRSAHGKA